MILRWYPRLCRCPWGNSGVFEGLYAQGHDQVLVTTISGHLSGSINGILAAAAELEVKMHIVAYDTKTVCFNEGVFALEACRMQEVSATFEDVIERHRLAANNLGIFAVEHLDFLIKNGRLSNASGFAANFLNIKPLLEVQSSGEILAVKKRTPSRASCGKLLPEQRNTQPTGTILCILSTPPRIGFPISGSS